MHASTWAFVSAAVALVFHAAPAHAAADPAFLAQYQRECAGVMQAYNARAARFGGGLDQHPALRSGETYFRAGADTTRRGFETALADLRKDMAELSEYPDEIAFRKIIECGLRVGLDYLQKKENAAAPPPPRRIPNSAPPAPPAPPGPIVSGPPQRDETDSDTDVKDKTPNDERVAVNKPRRKLPKPPEEKKIKGEPAHTCLALLKDPGTYGGFHNNCDFRVHYMYCTYHPSQKTDAKWADCDQVKAGSDGIDGIGVHGNQGGFTQSAEKIYWFACKAPSAPKGLTFKAGLAFSGRCG